MKVNVFGIGAPKCGTTTLYEVLSRAPCCCTSVPKETYFFNDNQRYSMGIEWYEKTHFPHYNGQSLVVDITPSYSWDQPKITASRIYKYNASAKIVLLMRDPLKRLVSEWKMCYANYYKGYASAAHNRNAVLGFKAWIEAKGGILECLRSSLYGTAINSYLSYFPASSIYVASQESMSMNYRKTFVDIFKFLGIPMQENLLLPIRANSASQLYGRLSAFAGCPALSILPSRIEKQMRYRLRHSWLTKEIRFPVVDIDQAIQSEIYAIVRKDCADSKIRLADQMALWKN